MFNFKTMQAKLSCLRGWNIHICDPSYLKGNPSYNLQINLHIFAFKNDQLAINNSSQVLFWRLTNLFSSLFSCGLFNVTSVKPSCQDAWTGTEPASGSDLPHASHVGTAQTVHQTPIMGNFSLWPLKADLHTVTFKRSRQRGGKC